MKWGEILRKSYFHQKDSICVSLHIHIKVHEDREVWNNLTMYIIVLDNNIQCQIKQYVYWLNIYKLIIRNAKF